LLDEIDMPKSGCEVKCKSPVEHARLMMVNNNSDLLEIESAIYWQIQTQMLVTETDYWYFAIYNPFAKKNGCNSNTQ